MLLSHRLVSTALALLVPFSVAAQDPPTKSPRPSTEVERFRALDPAERLKLVDKLAKGNLPFAAATRGDLVAAIIERGAVEPANVHDVVCKVKAAGKESTTATTIKWLIEDGSVVKKGDKLAQLDDSTIREQLEAAQVKANLAEAAKVDAVNALEATKLESEVEIRLAAVEIKLAEQDLKDPPQGQTKPVLELKLERAKLLYDRARSRAKGQQVRAEADFKARATAAEAEIQRLKDKETELGLCVLTAPIDGFAVHYAVESSRFGGIAAVVAVGEPVREGQKLLRVFDPTKLVVATRVHESVISSVRAGQSTRVRIDAFPTRDLGGKVTLVSSLPAQADWWAKDVKVYPVTIALDDVPPGLKPQMSAEVHITTGERKGVVQVPLKSVWIMGRKRLCFIKQGQELLEREITIGASNAASVEIKEGVKEGDQVLADATVVLGTTGEPAKTAPAGKRK